MLPLSQPRRILTVTGTGAARTTASATRTAFSGSRMRAEPSPLETIFPTGQPMLMSTMSAPLISAARQAASAMQTGSLPKIWTLAGCSPGKSFSNPRLLRS